MQTKIKVVFQVKERDVAGWPHINFNYSQIANQMISVLQHRMPNVKFDVAYCSSPEEAEAQFPSDRLEYDGILLVTSTNAPQVHKTYCDKADTQFPIVVADLPHAGSAAFLSVATKVCKNNLPIGLVSSMNYSDVAEITQIIEILSKLKQEKILIISDDTSNGIFSPAKRKALKDNWGCDNVISDSSTLFNLYQNIDNQKAEKLAGKWLQEAICSVEPSKEEIIRSAKLYYALVELMNLEGCTAVTVDCLSLFYNNKMKAYPCLAFFEMLNNEQVGICEADIDSVLSALIAKHGFNRPGYVSDPSIDTSSNQIIYDHCVCSNRMLGYDNPTVCEYYIRSHAEDQKGASVQTLLPLNQQITTYKFCTDKNAFSIHTGVSVGNVGLERGCRTKLAVNSNTEKILQVWDMDVFGWHKVSVYGDWRDKLINLARMKGMEIYLES